METPAPPLFRAMATSTRPIYQLLRCVSFSNKVHVEISDDGIKFIADHTRVMQGMASIGKSMFATYSLNLPQDGGGSGGNDDEDDEDDGPLPATFQISLPAFLEALQIFGVTDAPSRQIKQDPDNYRNMRGNGPGGANNGGAGRQGTDAFSHQILGMPGTCSISYVEDGAPFGIILEEASVKTTCNLATYVPEALEAIPFDRDNLVFKMIMQPRWLLDALIELAPASPNLLTIAVTPREPYLRLSSHGPLGSASVDFSRGRNLFESITVSEGWSQSFKFDLIKSSTEAMRIASKVSIRGDRQGVLSLQFMVEMDGSSGSSGGPGSGGGGAGNMQWLHFTFVPFMSDEQETDEEEEQDEEESHGNRGTARSRGRDDSDEDEL
ncbi:checkpoint clamp complex protein Rad1 [Sporothrix eucalyptigena]|uniref:Checkpoint clamp complex protein Rad1 n=1 Tax=Sporothrix eucalyptigena TaxID=1812306 RepID=A0ABP0AK98_9PEZI